MKRLIGQWIAWGFWELYAARWRATAAVLGALAITLIYAWWWGPAVSTGGYGLW